MTSTLPVNILPRLGQLVRLMASPSDGETLAAVRALDRTLRTAGSDLHALAACIEGQTSKPVKLAPPMLHPKMSLLTRDASVRWLTAIVAQDWTTEWERSFCSDLADRIYRQPHRLFSPRQIKACDKLLRRAYTEGVRV